MPARRNRKGPSSHTWRRRADCDLCSKATYAEEDGSVEVAIRLPDELEAFCRSHRTLALGCAGNPRRDDERKCVAGVFAGGHRRPGGRGTVAYSPSLPPELLTSRYGSAASGFIDVASAHAHVRDQGNPGIPVVLIHGANGSLHVWEGGQSTQ